MAETNASAAPAARAAEACLARASAPQVAPASAPRFWHGNRSFSGTTGVQRNKKQLVPVAHLVQVASYSFALICRPKRGLAQLVRREARCTCCTLGTSCFLFLRAHLSIVSRIRAVNKKQDVPSVQQVQASCTCCALGTSCFLFLAVVHVWRHPPCAKE